MTYEEAVAEICEATGITEFRFLKTRDKESLIERYYRKYPDELGEMWFKNVGELRGNADQILWYIQRNAEGSSHYTEIGLLVETLMVEQMTEHTQRLMNIFWSEHEPA